MKKNSPKNIWNKSADAWVDFVRTNKDRDRLELNNPAMFKMLGNIKGKRVLDLACGEGFNTRIITRKGAKVIGTDFAKEMIYCAIKQEAKDKLGVAYYVSDACNLAIFKNCTFDIVTCFMALQDIEDYQKAIKEVYRVLKKSGRFIFVIPHPWSERRVIGKKLITGWEFRKGTRSRSPKSALYFQVDRYFDRYRYIINWNMKRLTKHFKSMAFHRTLTDYCNALAKAGFLISRLIEPKPTPKGLAKYPVSFERTLRVPSSIVIEAVPENR